jgi:hypothetical protein
VRRYPKMKVASVAPAIAALVFWIGAGCGGGGGGGTPAGPAGDSWSAAIYDIQRRVQELRATDPEADLSAVAAIVASRPELEDVETTEDGVWAVFSDGRLYAVLEEPRSAGGGGGEASADPARLLAGSLAVTAIPGSSAAHLHNTHGPRWVSSLPDTLGPMLEAKGYQVARGTGTIEELMAVQDAGVFCIQTHGGVPGPAKRQRFHLLKTYYMATGTARTPAGDEAFADLLDDRTMGYVLVKKDLDERDNYVYQTSYIVNSDFVRANMTFDPQGFACIQACSSFDGEFTSAFFEVGASAYAGWTKSVAADDGYTSIRYLFDRLLGTNAVLPEDPEQRPFDWLSVLEDMKLSGYATSVRGSEFRIASRDSTFEDFGLLAPSIGWMLVGEACAGGSAANQIYIDGIFGPTQGEVTLNGAPLEVVSWWPSFITCRVPPSGAGSAGDVLVSVDGHESNPRALTAWRGTMTLVLPGEGGSLKDTIEWDLHFRADVGERRDAPGEPARKPAGVEAPVMFDSTCRFRSEGQYVTTFLGQTTTTVWSGSGAIPNGRATCDDVLESFDFVGTIDVAGRAVVVDYLHAHSADDSKTVTVDGAPSGDNVVWYIDGSRPFRMPLADDWSIPAGQADVFDVGGTTPARISWSRMEVSFPPGEDDAR